MKGGKRMEDNTNRKNYDNGNDKPVLLKAVEIILADPAEIKKRSYSFTQ